jgi:molecular chaperone GrpE
MSEEKRKDIPAAEDAVAELNVAETTVLPESSVGEADSEDLSPEELLNKANEMAEENWSKYLRAVAEQDNLRKRHARELENARRFGVEGLAAELLSVADSLEMALETGTAAPAESLLEGGRATLKQLQGAMEKFGVESVLPEGEPFDPEFHEAMSVQESDTAEPDTVLAVVQRGYRLNGRLLRPARVIVAKEPSS